MGTFYMLFGLFVVFTILQQDLGRAADVLTRGQETLNSGDEMGCCRSGKVGHVFFFPGFGL